MYRPNPNFDSSKDRVAGILREHGLLSSTAFVNVVYDDIKNKGGNFLDVQAILNAARRHNVPEDETLWDGVFTDFEDFNTIANRSLILSETKPPITATNLQNALHDIFRDDQNRLTLTPQAYAKQQRTNNRRIWINAITGSGQHKNYPLWAANYGAFKWIPSESLDNESDELLEALAQRVPEWRKQIAGDRPQREQLPDGVTATQHARERELESDEFLLFPGSNPPREYTIKEAKQNLRELLFYPDSRQGRGPRRVKAVNRLLSGRRFGE